MDREDLEAALRCLREALAGFRELTLTTTASIWQTPVADIQMRIGRTLLRQGKAEVAATC